MQEASSPHHRSQPQGSRWLTFCIGTAGKLSGAVAVRYIPWVPMLSYVPSFASITVLVLI